VPVEVVQFGWQATAAALQKLGADPVLRHATEDHPFITDGGNYTLDCRFASIPDPVRLEGQIGMTVGVVESGLFIGRASTVIVATSAGTEIMTPRK
jgi:ribose 5-phosphate isomerase A